MRTRVPLRCVQATAAADTARFRLWTEPADTDYEGSLDFKGRAADFHGTRRASGRVLRTVSLPDATFLREPDRPGWMRLHSSRWRQGSWDPFGVLDVVAALDELVPTEPEPTMRGVLQHHVGQLPADVLQQLTDDASTVMRRVRPLPPAEEDGAAEVSVWLDSRHADPSCSLSHHAAARGAPALRAVRLLAAGPGRDPRALRLGRPRRAPRGPADRGLSRSRQRPGAILAAAPCRVV